MAENKNSFILYADYIHTIEYLTDEQAGQVFKHLLEYVNDKNPPLPDDVVLKLAITPIKRQLKRDLKDWENEKTERANSAVLGNIARWHPDIFAQIKQGQLNINDAIEKISSLKSAGEIAIPPDPTASDRNPTASDRNPTASDRIANIAVNDNVNVTVNDTVTNKEDKSSLPDGGKKAKEEIVGVKKKDQLKIPRPKKKVPPKKKGQNPDSEPYWYLIRKKWIWFNKTHVKFNVEPIPDRDYSHIHRIIEKLRARAVAQAVEWTEANALSRWEKFLTIAYTKDDWLHNNFLAGNLESKMQKVFNLIDNPNGQHTKGRQGSTTSSVGKTIEFDRP